MAAFPPIRGQQRTSTGEIYGIALDLGTARSALSVWVSKGPANWRFDICPDTHKSDIKADCKTETVLIFSSPEALGTPENPVTVHSPATNASYNQATVGNNWVNIGPRSLTMAEDCVQTAGEAYYVRDFKMELDLQSRRTQEPGQPVRLNETTVLAYPLHEDGQPIQVGLWQVMTAYIACAAKLALEELQSHVHNIKDPKLTMPRNEEVNWVITVPAIWLDQARIFMREVSSAAVLSGDAFSEKISVCLEPEGAMLEVVHTNTVRDPDSLQGKPVLVLDWGGGTCDISFSIVRSAGAVKVAELEEISPSVGGPFGGRMFNEVLNRSVFLPWLGEQLYWEVWINKGLRDRFMRGWLEKQKASGLNNGWRISFEELFEGTLKNDLLLDLLEKLNEGCKPDERLANGKVRGRPWVEIPDAIVARCFNACIDPVLDLVRPFVEHKTPPECIFVVGGMAQNPYLKRYLMDSYLPSHKLLFHENAGMAIVRGAVRVALDSSLVIRRRALTNYGLLYRDGPDLKWTTVLNKGMLLEDISKAQLPSFSPQTDQSLTIRFQIYESTDSIGNKETVLNHRIHLVTEALLQVNMSVPYTARSYNVVLSMRGPVLSGSIIDASTQKHTPIKWSSR